MIKVVLGKEHPFSSSPDLGNVTASGLTPGEVLEIVDERANLTLRITRIGHDHIVQRLEGTD